MAYALKSTDFQIARGISRIQAERDNLEGAIAALSEGVGLNPDDLALRAERITRRQAACDWSDFAVEQQTILDALDRDASGVLPLLATMLDSTPEQQFKAATRYATDNGFNTVPSLFSVPRTYRAKPRIGCVSSDFRDHPVAIFMAALLGAHDKTEFEIIGYSRGPENDSAGRRDIAALCDRFVDLHALSDHAAPRRSASRRTTSIS